MTLVCASCGGRWDSEATSCDECGGQTAKVRPRHEGAQSVSEAAATVRRCGLCPADDMCKPPNPNDPDCINCAEAEAALSLLVEQAENAARWLAWSGGQYPDDSPGDVIAAYQDGTIVLDDGITTWNPVRACAYFARRAERAASLEARAMYIASEYDCYCETPGVSNDCAVCEVRAALAAGSEGET